MNIIIAGATCSGKTTLANNMNNAILDTTIIAQDNYFKDLDNIPKYRGNYLFDSINAFEYMEYLNDIDQFLRTGSIKIPRYNIYSNQRLSKDLKLIKKRLLICEGLHTITILNELTDSLKIFIDTDLEKCLERRIERDEKLYGISPALVSKYFKEIIIPLYKEYIEPQKEHADIILKKEEDYKWILRKLIK